MSARREAGALPLLLAILRDTPTLPGAACIGHHDIVDAANAGIPDAIEAHRLMCQHCPQRSRCPHDRGGDRNG